MCNREATYQNYWYKESHVIMEWLAHRTPRFRRLSLVLWHLNHNTHRECLSMYICMFFLFPLFCATLPNTLAFSLSRSIVRVRMDVRSLVYASWWEKCLLIISPFVREVGRIDRSWSTVLFFSLLIFSLQCFSIERWMIDWFLASLQIE